MWTLPSFQSAFSNAFVFCVLFGAVSFSYLVWEIRVFCSCSLAVFVGCGVPYVAAFVALLHVAALTV